MKFSLKKEKSVFWSTNYSLQEIQDKLAREQINEDWLVCPLGESERAVPVSEFIDRPSMFDPVPKEVNASPLNVPAIVPDPATNVSSGKRYHHFDALRGFAMLLGIVMHGLLSFVDLPIWPAQDIHQNHEVYSFFQYAIHGFRMPLFFLVSGFFTAMMWHKRGAKGLIAHRFERIFVPLFFGTFLIWPLIIGVGVFGGMAKQKRSELQAGENHARMTAGSDIWIAAKKGDLESLQKSIGGGADVNRRDHLRVSPLEWAAMYNRGEAIAVLVDKGARINEKNHDGSTPLHMAAFFGRAEAVKKLVGLGADAGARNNTGGTPLAAARMDMGIVELIAGVTGVQFNRVEVAAGKRETASYLKGLVGVTSDGKAEVTRASQEAIDEGADRNGQGPVQVLFGGIYLAATFFPVFHHLWFLYYLLWLVGIFLVAVWIRGLFPAARIPRWMIATPWCLIWLVPATLLPQFFMTQTFGVDTAPGLLPWPPKLIYYAIFFGFGALCFGQSEFEEKAGRRWALMFVMALPTLLIGLRLFETRDGGPTAQALLSLCAVVYAWLMVFGMIGLFRRFFAKENKRIRYLSDSSYWLYIAHLPLIMGLQVWVSLWNVHHFPKFLLVCTLTFAILIVMYEYLIRYTSIGTTLNGRKTRPAKDPVS